MMWKVVLPVLAALLAVGSGTLLGGLQTIDVTDERALEALDFAVAEHVRSGDSMCEHQVGRVVDVRRQIVSGIKYVITVEMVKTCQHGSANEARSNFQDPAEVQRYKCIFTVVTVAWLNQTTLENQSC